MRKQWKRILTGVVIMAMAMVPMGAMAAGIDYAEVGAFDWGPSVTKVVVRLDESVEPGDVAADKITVSEHKQFMDFQNMASAEADFSRAVLDAYTCDEQGNRIEAASGIVAIEMAVSPNDGSPFFYDFPVTGQNKWATPYELKVTLPQGEISESISKWVIPAADGFEGPVASGELSYSFYAPKDAEGLRPLIIWLHGAGEGGTDPKIAELGNKVTALIDPKIQDLFGGAWVLCPQSPTMWMDNGDKNPDTGAPVYVNDENHVSIYTKALNKLIVDFIAEHGDAIDPAKVIVGGCSNGGFMTMNMVMKYPELFAAAYPVCEAYVDSWIGEEELASLAKVPSWFTYAENDTVVDPLLNAAPTVERLKAAGADVHVSVWPNVVDMTGLYKDAEGNAYEYMGHWSWLYVLNDECVEELDGGSISIWNWLAGKVQ